LGDVDAPHLADALRLCRPAVLRVPARPCGAALLAEVLLGRLLVPRPGPRADLDVGFERTARVRVRPRPAVACDETGRDGALRRPLGHSLLERDVLPTLGRAKVAAVRRPHVARLHLAMSDRPYLANRALAILAAMFRFAELHDQRPRGSNPCVGIEPYPERARERFLSEAEFVRLGAALGRAEREGLPVPEKLRARSRGVSAARRAKATGRKRGPHNQRRVPEGGPRPCLPRRRRPG
jgi:hypothetical protein